MICILARIKTSQDGFYNKANLQAKGYEHPEVEEVSHEKG